LVLLDKDWHEEIVLTVALVPVRLSVCALLAPLLFTVSVACSSVPAVWLGINLNTMVQLEPLLRTNPLEQVPRPVLAKSPAFPPLMLK
jgi:hypothetical protein